LVFSNSDPEMIRAIHEYRGFDRPEWLDARS
jgi:hypothetical protein